MAEASPSWLPSGWRLVRWLSWQRPVGCRRHVPLAEQSWPQAISAGAPASLEKNQNKHSRCGALAQLVEHLIRIHKVRGSNPLSSTFFFFRKTNTSRKQMRYSASKIAALLGRFGAKQRTEAILEVWQRASPATLRAALTRRAALRCGANPFAPVPVPRPIAALLAQPCATPTQVAERKAAGGQAISSALPSLVQEIQSANTSADQSTAVPSADQSTVEPVPSTQVLSAQIEASLVEHCEREIHTDYGTRQESPVVARFAAQYGQR